MRRRRVRSRQCRSSRPKTHFPYRRLLVLPRWSIWSFFFLEIFLRLTVLAVDARFAARGILELSEPGLAKGCGLCSKSFHVARIQRDTCALADQCGNVHFLKIFWRRERHAGGGSWPSDDSPGRCTPAAGAGPHRHAIINGVWASWHDLKRFLIVAQRTGDSRDTTKTVAPALRRAQDRPGSCPCRGPIFSISWSPLHTQCPSRPRAVVGGIEPRPAPSGCRRYRQSVCATHEDRAVVSRHQERASGLGTGGCAVAQRPAFRDAASAGAACVICTAPHW